MHLQTLILFLFQYWGSSVKNTDLVQEQREHGREMVSLDGSGWTWRKGLYVCQIESPRRSSFFLFNLQSSQHRREGVGAVALKRTVLVVDSLLCFFSFAFILQPTADEGGEYYDGSSVLSYDTKVIFLTSHSYICICFSLDFELRNWAKTSLPQRIAHCAYPTTLRGVTVVWRSLYMLIRIVDGENQALEACSGLVF